jgi:hypothetical protein
VVVFSAVAQSPAFARHVSTSRITDMSNRYRKDLSVAQQRLLTDLLRDDLTKYGYDVSDASIG